MLTPQQISTLQAQKAPTGGMGAAASSNKPMDDAAFQSWIGNKPAATPQASPETAPSKPLAGLNISNPIQDVKNIYNAGKGAIDQIVAGYNKFKSAGGAVIPEIEGVVQSLAGGVGLATAPAAPAMQPVNDLVNKTGEAVSSIPAVQKFATTPAGQTTARVAEDVGNLSTVAGAVAGGMKVPEAMAEPKTPIVETPKPPIEPIDSLVKEAGQVTPERAQSSAWKDLQPKPTATTKLAYAKQQLTKPQGLIKSGELTPSPADTKLIADYSKMYEDGTIKESMTPQEKQAAISQKAAQLHMQQKEFLATNDKAVTLSDAKGKTGLFDQLKATAKRSALPFSKDPATKGAYDAVIETYKSLLDTGKTAGTVKGASTLTKIDAALTSLDAEMQKFKAWGQTKTGEMTDTGMARQQAIRDIHTVVRDYIASQLPKNSPWKAIRLEESNMYQIGDRLAQRSAETVGTSKVGAAIKNNPLIKTAAHAAGAATGAGAAIHLIP